MQDSEHALSVVICTRNRRDSLRLTLDSLGAQRWGRKWEVLVVDNAGNDGTFLDVSERAAAFPVPLRVVREEVPGLSRARNRGLHEARGRAVVFIDDDVNCKGGWVAAHGRSFNDGRVSGTAGRILPLLPPETPDWFRQILPTEIGGPTSRYDFGLEPGRIGKLGLPFPFGANMGIRRRVALEVGGFRTDLGWGQRMIPSEDLEFFERVREAQRGIILYVPKATVEHRITPERTTLGYYKRWQQAYGRAQVLRGDPPHRLIEYYRRINSLLQEFLRFRQEVRLARSKRDKAGEIAAIREFERAKGSIFELARLFFGRRSS